MAIKPRDSDNTELRVTEIFAVAVLRTKGVRLLGVEPTHSGRVAFLFDDHGGRAGALVQEHREDIIFGSRG